MGQKWNRIPQYTNDKVKNYRWILDLGVTDMNRQNFREGWWNTNEEFDVTMAELEQYRSN